MKAIVWSKPDCPYCVAAKKLLTNKGIEIDERVLGFGWNREQLFEAVPNVRTVPQIFLDGEYIGGHDDLVKHFAKNVVKTSVQQQWENTSFPHD
jgi:glutaredoxin 3